MKILNFRCFSVAVIIILSFTFVHPALAHGDNPRLEISVERMNPGGILEVRGVGFDYDESVTLYLEAPGIMVQLGNVTADVEGIFLHIAVLPVDLPEGVYNIRGVTSHHDVLSPALTVQGPAILEGGGQGERDEDDGLLAPMPTYAPGFVPGSVPEQVAQPTSQERPVSRGLSTTLLALSFVLVLAVFVAFRGRTARKS